MDQQFTQTNYAEISQERRSLLAADRDWQIHNQIIIGLNCMQL